MPTEMLSRASSLVYGAQNRRAKYFFRLYIFGAPAGCLEGKLHAEDRCSDRR
jgi:hypothetical protein